MQKVDKDLEMFARSAAAPMELLTIGEDGFVQGFNSNTEKIAIVMPQMKSRCIPVCISKVKKGLKFSWPDGCMHEITSVKVCANVVLIRFWNTQAPPQYKPESGDYEWLSFISSLVEVGINPYVRESVYEYCETHAPHDFGGWVMANKYNQWWMEQKGLVPKSGRFPW